MCVQCVINAGKEYESPAGQTLTICLLRSRPPNYHTEYWWTCCHDNSIDSEARRWLRVRGDVAGVCICLRWHRVKRFWSKRRGCHSAEAFLFCNPEFHVIQPIYHQQYTAASQQVSTAQCSISTATESWGFAAFLCLMWKLNWTFLSFCLY